jgi:hypothetical protein
MQPLRPIVFPGTPPLMHGNYSAKRAKVPLKFYA